MKYSKLLLGLIVFGCVITPARVVSAEEVHETVELESELTSTDDMTSSDELFEQYVQKAFEIDGEPSDDESIQSSSYAEGYLNSDEQVVYNKVKELVPSIANGQNNNPVIAIDDELLNNPTMTVENLVTYTNIGGTITPKINDDVFQSAVDELNKQSPNRKKIMEAVIKDCPYELYWYGRVYSFGYRQISYDYDKIDPSSLAEGESTQANGSVTLVSYEAKLYVDQNYADANDFEVDSKGAKVYTHADTSKTGGVSSAVSNAAAIVEKYKTEDDFVKLHSYKEEICELVTYNTEAPGHMATLGSDPWEMIYVFDGDPTTNVVCEGYSKAFQYLCEKSDFAGDVKVINVSGYMDGGAHMWNIVSYQGSNYLVDVTNCDNIDEYSKGHEGLFMKGYKSGSVAEGYTVYCELPEGYKSHDILYKYDENTLTLLRPSYDYITLSSSDFDPAIGNCVAEYTFDGETKRFDSIEAALKAASDEKKGNTTINIDLLKNATANEELIANGGIHLNLNGHTVTVNGNMTMTQGIDIAGGKLKVNGLLWNKANSVNIGGGTLECEGLRLCGDDDTATSANLVMDNASDEVYVFGNLYIRTQNVNSQNSKLQNGVLAVTGDITDKSSGNFMKLQAGSNHLLVLAGSSAENLQTISLMNDGFFYNVSLTENHPGTIKVDGSIGIKNLQNDLTINPAGEKPVNLNYFNLDGKTLTVNGDATITNGIFLDGGTLNVNGNLTQETYRDVSEQNYPAFKLDGGLINVDGTLWQKHGVMYVDGGTVDVKGYTICEADNVKSKASIHMESDDDVINVDGDFYMNPSTDTNWWQNHFYKGTMYVSGDFAMKGTSGFGITAKDTHKFVLTGSGDTPQLVDVPSNNYFGDFAVIPNAYNDMAAGQQPVVPDVTMKVKVAAGIGILKLGSDIELCADAYPVSLKDMRLNGHNVIVDGDAIGYTAMDLQGGCLDVKGVLNQRTGIIHVNEGTLFCKGLELSGADRTKSTMPSGGFSALIDMENDADYVFVDGDFYMNTYISNYQKCVNTLTAGTLVVSGNFTEVKTDETAFAASGAHRTVFTGGPEGNYTVTLGSDKGKFNDVYVYYPDCYTFIPSLKCKNIYEKQYYDSTDAPQIELMSLSLDGRIGVNTYIDVPEKVLEDAGAYVLCKEQKTYIRDLETVEENGKTLYLVKTLVNAKDIRKSYPLRICDASGIAYAIKGSNGLPYENNLYEVSAKKYIDAALADENESEQLKKCMQAMLYYGDVANEYFVGGAEAVAPTGELGEHLNSISGTGMYEGEVGNLPAGIKYVGSSLILKADTTIRHYFMTNQGIDVSSYDFNCNGTKLTPSESNGMYYIDISNISAGDLDKAFELKIGNDRAIKYSVESYMRKALERTGNDKLVKLVKALKLYGDMN